MLARRHARLALAAVFVCGLARPAFADGALGVWDNLSKLIIAVLVLFGLVIVVPIVVMITRSMRPRADERPEKAESPERPEKAESPELPEARVMSERSQSGPKQ